MRRNWLVCNSEERAFFPLNHMQSELGCIFLSVYQQYLSIVAHVTCHNYQGKKGLGHTDLNSLPALFTLFERCGLLLGNKRLPKNGVAVWHMLVILISSTDKIFQSTARWFLEMTAPQIQLTEYVPMPQSLLSSAQDIGLSQHPPVLQAQVTDSELWQSKNGHVCFFHSVSPVLLQTAGESIS